MSVSKIFWNEFLKHEKLIHENLLKKTQTDYDKSNEIISNILSKLQLNDKLGIYFGIDIRNGMKLNERKNYIEMIISPLFKKNNQKHVIDLYDESFKHTLPAYWSIVKYKFFRPHYIDIMTLTYSVNDDIVEINKTHFNFHSFIDHENYTISILLFIDDKISPHLIKKEKYNDREIYVPIDNSIHMVLDTAIGEYNLLNIIDKIEIHPTSVLKTDEFKNIETFPIEKLIEKVKIVTSNSLKHINSCSRCEYSNSQVKLMYCKCRKVFYCDKICQKAHRKLHVLNGCL